MSTLNGQNNDHDQELLQAIEQIVQQNMNTTHDPHSPLGVGARLASTVPQPDAAFAARLEARLVAIAEQRKEATMSMIDTQRKPTERRVVTSGKQHKFYPAFRMTTIAATAILLMVGLVAAVPPARAWAQDAANDLLAYFGFERGTSGLSLPVPSASAAVAIQVEPSTMPLEQPDDCVTLDTGDTFCGAIPDFRTRDEAEAQVGFVLKMPTYLPPNYVASSMFEVVSPNIIVWGAGKQHIEGRPETLCEPGVELRQVHPVSSDAQPAYIGNAAATTVTILEQPALLIENLQEGIGPCTYGDATGQLGTFTPITNVLVWEQDDIRYYLSADARLGRDELIKIAESLR